MIADSYDLKEVEDAFFFEVEGSVRHQLDAAWAGCIWRLQSNL